RRVIRPLLWLWTIVTVAWLALSPVWSANEAPTYEETFDVARIQNYDADFRVDANGDLAVTERLHVYFPVGRHGIFRFFDVVDPSAPTARRLPENIHITRDGRPEQADRSTREHDRFIVYRIGDPAVEIEGEHVYSLSYRIRGVIEPGTTGERSQLYWNLIPGGWTMPIDAANLTVHLPVASSATVRCAVGSGTASRCASSGAGTRRLTVRTGALPERTPVTIKAGLDMQTPPTGHARWWPQPWDGVLGRWSKTSAPIALGAVALLAAIAGFAGWRVRRRVVETEPPFPVMYAPPDGIGPGQAAYVVSESVSRTQFVATLLYLAQQKVITLDRNDTGWTIGNGPALGGDVDPVSKAAIAPLPLHAGKPMRIEADKKIGKKLQLSETSFLAAPRRWALEHGVVEEVGGVGKAGMWAVVSVVAALVVAIAGFGMSALCVIPLSFALPALGVIRTGASTRRTEAGRRLWSEAGGFKRMLATPSSEQRFDFSARTHLYTAYIPWAVAFGVADRWAEKYRFETGEVPPAPGYVGGLSDDSDSSWADSGASTSMASAVEASFAAAVGSAIGAYVASIAPSSSTSSSSSSWSSSDSGGGFSGGGGGGGGGGGSW
ncbi:MAG TPA: DUF2207 domain-containing protein, partial [Aeromicrobium sp.]|nr:DUF2207 domain-containing protein [Aeromicrobium sp.]